MTCAGDGKHKHRGAKVQVISAPDGWPIRVSAVRSGREHDITCARNHDAIDSMADIRDDLPALTDLGYEGAGDTVRVPVRKPVSGRHHAAVLRIPATAWTTADEPGDEVRDGAWVAELDGDCLKGWPAGMRLIVRRERPHPGAQLRFTDADGMRPTCLATNTKDMPIAVLELRHRQHARAEDRIRAARATGRRSLPLHDPRRTGSGWRLSRSCSTCRRGCRCPP